MADPLQPLTKEEREAMKAGIRLNPIHAPSAHYVARDNAQLRADRDEAIGRRDAAMETLVEFDQRIGELQNKLDAVGVADA